MSVLNVDYLIESAKYHLELSKYWRGVGNKAKAAEQLEVAKVRRKQAAQALRAL